MGTSPWAQWHLTNTGIKGFFAIKKKKKKKQLIIKYQQCSSIFLRNTIKVRVCSTEFTCNRGRKNNLALPGIRAGKTLQHNWSTVYKLSPETWFRWVHLQRLPYRGVSFLRKEKWRFMKSKGSRAYIPCRIETYFSLFLKKKGIVFHIVFYRLI